MEGRSLSEVAHLAALGVNMVRAGILGLQRIKAASNRCFLLLGILLLWLPFYDVMILTGTGKKEGLWTTAGN